MHGRLAKAPDDPLRAHCAVGLHVRLRVDAGLRALGAPHANDHAPIAEAVLAAAIAGDTLDAWGREHPREHVVLLDDAWVDLPVEADELASGDRFPLVVVPGDLVPADLGLAEAAEGVPVEVRVPQHDDLERAHVAGLHVQVDRVEQRLGETGGLVHHEDQLPDAVFREIREPRQQLGQGLVVEGGREVRELALEPFEGVVGSTGAGGLDPDHLFEGLLLAGLLGGQQQDARGLAEAVLVVVRPRDAVGGPERLAREVRESGDILPHRLPDPQLRAVQGRAHHERLDVRRVHHEVDYDPQGEGVAVVGDREVTEEETVVAVHRETDPVTSVVGGNLNADAVRICAKCLFAAFLPQCWYFRDVSGDVDPPRREHPSLALRHSVRRRHAEPKRPSKVDDVVLESIIFRGDLKTLPVSVTVSVDQPCEKLKSVIPGIDEILVGDALLPIPDAAFENLPELVGCPLKTFCLVLWVDLVARAGRFPTGVRSDQVAVRRCPPFDVG